MLPNHIHKSVRSLRLLSSPHLRVTITLHFTRIIWWHSKNFRNEAVRPMDIFCPLLKAFYKHFTPLFMEKLYLP